MSQHGDPTSASSTIYDQTITLNTGEALSLSSLSGGPILIVNTASKCGFTPQYKELEELHKAYGERGLSVIGCPCNQFGKQEPGSDAEVQSFCELNFGVSFRLSRKLEVNGDAAHPLFVALKRLAPGLLGSERIKWNFTKFLVLPPHGADQVAQVRRYGPQTSPLKLKGEIERALTQSMRA